MALPDLRLPSWLSLPDKRSELLQYFADQVYGPIPPALSVAVEPKEIPESSATRLHLLMRNQGQTLQVDAALWRAPNQDAPRVIAVLDFLGPIGCFDADFPIDGTAVVCLPNGLGEGGRLTEAARGTTAHRVPVELLMAQGYSVLVSCYGSWTPDCPSAYRKHGIGTLFPGTTGAISMWAWAFHRLVDVAMHNVGAQEVVLAGHSRLGKAALWAAAHDTRVDAVFANQSGCFGAAPHTHPVGETPEQLIKRYPHWVMANGKPALDQHLMLALLAPRRLHLGQAQGDQWADPNGSIHALKSISSVWGNGRSGPSYHLREGGHDLLPEDWQKFFEAQQH